MPAVLGRDGQTRGVDGYLVGDLEQIRAPSMQLAYQTQACK